MDTQERITRDDLRGMAMGETREFALPSAAACDSGKSTANQLGNHLQCRFVVRTDYARNILTITKAPRDDQHTPDC